MKKLRLIFAVAAISLLACFNVFAGEWKQNDAGWWYDNGDTTFAKDGWNWIDGKCYYFTPDGYCLMNTSTPDGYVVDESGAWIVDGVVQTQETSADQDTYVLGDLTITCPEGFTYEGEYSTERELTFASHENGIIYKIVILPKSYYIESDFDEALTWEHTIISKSLVQFSNKTWIRYILSQDGEGITMYVRFGGDKIYMGIFCFYDHLPVTPDMLMENVK